MTQREKNVLPLFKELSAKDRAEKRELLSTPVQAIDLAKPTTIAGLVDAFANASIQARNIGTCAKIWEQMLTDPDRPTILLALAGPLVAAGLRKVIRDLIEYNLVDVVVSTGAILYQDYYQARGYQHYRGTPDGDDGVLRDLYIDRIYDTYVDEEGFIDTDLHIGRIADALPPGNYSSRQFLELMTRDVNDPNSILVTAARHGVPLFAPAINDSSIGIGLTEHYHRCRTQQRAGIAIDSIQDNYELTQIVVQSKCTAAIYIAGGVPKNYVNDSIVMAYIFDRDTGGHRYAIQLTADNPHWGGLSGSTLSEATSWGKVSKQATHAMAFSEPSVSLPLVAGSILEKRLGERRKRMSFQWEPPFLRGLGQR